MKYIFTLITFIFLQLALYSQQSDTLNWETIITSSNWKTYTSVKDLDTKLISKFPQWKDMSRVHGRFEATDVGGGPRERLFFAANYQNYWIVSYEHGGRGYHTHCFFIKMISENEFLVYQSHKKFKTLEELQSFVSTQDIPMEIWDGYDY